MNYKFFILIQCTLFFVAIDGKSKKNSKTSTETETRHRIHYVGDAKVIYPSLVDVNTFAFKTIPRGLVYIAQSSIPNAGLGVFAARPIARFTAFGPFGGIKRNYTGSNKPSVYDWTVHDDLGRIMYYIDASGPHISNWLRFVNCPNIRVEQNLWPFTHRGEIFYVAIEDIEVGEELLVYYGHSYARKLGIDVKEFC